MNEDENAARVLSARYGLTGKLTKLGGDMDTNFRVELESGQRYVFKMMHTDCAVDVVALQCAVLRHLSESPLRLPTVVSSLAGRDWEIMGQEGNTRIVWLLSWCEGTLLADFSPHNEAVYTSFGKVLAQLDNALENFSAPALSRQSRWNLTQALESAEYVADIGGDTRAIVQLVFERFERHTRKALTTLPAGFIHNDANDYNVLVNTVDGAPVVDGLFDFGDIARQPIICDVAIALAYLILGKDDPLAVCTTFLTSYMAQRPLRAEELAILFDLIQTRLAVSIAISSHRALTEKDDPYMTVSQKPAIRALQQLAGLSSDEVEFCFRLISA